MRTGWNSWITLIGVACCDRSAPPGPSTTWAADHAAVVEAGASPSPASPAGVVILAAVDAGEHDRPRRRVHEASVAIDAAAPSACSISNCRISFGGPKDPRNLTYRPPATLYMPLPSITPTAFGPGLSGSLTS